MKFNLEKWQLKYQDMVTQALKHREIISKFLFKNNILEQFSKLLNTIFYKLLNKIKFHKIWVLYEKKNLSI